MPFIWVVSFFAMALIGMIKFRRIPIYGVDEDPGGLALDWIGTPGFLAGIIGFYTTPINILLIIYLLSKNAMFTAWDKIALVIFLLSLTLFYVAKYLMPDLFMWVMD